MKHFMTLTQALSTFVAGQERPKNLAAADTSSAFMVLACIRMLGSATTTSVASFIAERWELDLSFQNVGNMLKRLERWRLIAQIDGTGRKNDPSTYVLTTEGETELINGIKAHAILLKAGLDSIQNPSARSKGGFPTIKGASGNVTWMARKPAEFSDGDRRRAGGRKK